MARPQPNVKKTAAPSPAAPAVPAPAPALQTETTTMDTVSAPSPAVATDPAVADPTSVPAKPPRKPRSPSVSVAHLYKDAVIDENIPMPINVSAGGSRGRQGGYPFARLVENGNSFFIPVSPENPAPVKRLGSSVASMNKKCRPLGYQYICLPWSQKYADGSVVEGARVWRMAYQAPDAQTTPAA